MAATGLQYLNGLDLWATYGLAVSKGNADMLLFPERKESLSKNWIEENGIDIDLTMPRFEAKEVKLKCLLMAPDAATWWSRRNAFFDAITAPGWHTWRVADHDKDYSVFYRKAANPNVYSGSLKKGGDVGYTFDLELMVSEELIANTPVVSSEPVYIRDQNGNLIATVQPGQTYTLESTDVLYNSVYMKSIPPGTKLNVTSPYSLKFNIVI